MSMAGLAGLDAHAQLNRYPGCFIENLEGFAVKQKLLSELDK